MERSFDVRLDRRVIIPTAGYNFRLHLFVRAAFVMSDRHAGTDRLRIKSFDQADHVHGLLVTIHLHVVLNGYSQARLLAFSEGELSRREHAREQSDHDTELASSHRTRGACLAHAGISREGNTCRSSTCLVSRIPDARVLVRWYTSARRHT